MNLSDRTYSLFVLPSYHNRYCYYQQPPQPHDNHNPSVQASTLAAESCLLRRLLGYLTSITQISSQYFNTANINTAGIKHDFD